MKYLTAEKQATRFYFKVHLDDTKPQTPENVREFEWGITQPQGQTEKQYLDNIKREIGLLVADELLRINPQPAPATISLAGF